MGVGDVTEALSEEISHLNRGISIALDSKLNATTVRRLLNLQKLTERYLRSLGYRYLSIPPDSDRRNGTFVSRLYELFSHKTAATCSGLGWIGKNGLVINPDYGPALSWATVLTDAPFEPDRPITESLCGECDLCVQHCPSRALTGRTWSVRTPYERIVIYERCRSLKKGIKAFEAKPNCGFCINICPYMRRAKGYPQKRESRCLIRGVSLKEVPL